MKIDTILSAPDWAGLPEEARRLETEGFDGAWTAEVAHDPFFPLAIAAPATSRIDLGTSIAVAFARSPMTLAYTANDLQAASHGRFILGLGSQVKAHVTRRFSMPWGHPAAQMREYILALRAIWAHWNEGQPLAFEGEYYRHTLMTATFRPSPNPFGAPRIFLAAVGPAMTRVAGEVTDGLVVHGFTTERYLREVTLPALAEGAEKAGRARSDIEVTCPGFLVLDDGSDGVAAKITGVRNQIAFYGSTPAYKPVLALHGWGDLADQLHALSVTKDEGRWAKMGELITDDVLHAFAVVGTPAEAGAELKRRYGDIVDRVTVARAAGAPADQVKDLLAGLR